MPIKFNMMHILLVVEGGLNSAYLRKLNILYYADRATGAEYKQIKQKWCVHIANAETYNFSDCCRD